MYTHDTDAKDLSITEAYRKVDSCILNSLVSVEFRSHESMCSRGVAHERGIIDKAENLKKKLVIRLDKPFGNGYFISEPDREMVILTDGRESGMMYVPFKLSIDQLAINGMLKRNYAYTSMSYAVLCYEIAKSINKVI